MTTTMTTTMTTKDEGEIMRLTLNKEIIDKESILDEVRRIDLKGDMLKEFLLETLPIVMEDTIDPDIDHARPEVYINNLFRNKLGDFDQRLIIKIGEGITKALLIGIRKQDCFHVLTVGVNKAYRKNNHGRNIIMYCCNEMFQETCSSIKLNVHSTNFPALQLYNKLGFVIESGK